MLEEKIAKAKDSLGFDDDELAKLLSKLEFVEAPPR
jgi:ADP-dependent phosphofructokinase/glucokinase